MPALIARAYQTYWHACHVLLQEGWTALSLASWRGHTKVVDILVQAGALINIQDKVMSRLYNIMNCGNHADLCCTGGIDSIDAGHPKWPC